MNEKPLNSKTVGRRLREERERLNMTQERLAQETGVRRVTVYQYEKGDRLPSLDYLSKAAIAGVSVQYVLFGQRKLIEAGDRFIDADLSADLYRLVEKVAVDAKGRSLHQDVKVALFEELVSVAINLRADEVDTAEIDRVVEAFAA